MKPSIWTHGAAALCLALALTACSQSAGNSAANTAANVSGTLGENVVTATAKVKAVDVKTRHVTLQHADGRVVTFKVGDDVRNLPQVKVGDDLNVTYYESLAYEVRKAEEGAPGASVSGGAARAALGEKPAGLVGQAFTLTATIAAIDTSAPSVTLRAPNGEESTFKVRDRQKLERVKVGDLVDITYTEALAISVEPPTK